MASGQRDWTTRTINVTPNLEVSVDIAESVEHFSGSVGTSEADISFSQTSVWVIIDNKDDTNSLLVSFDGGSNWKTLELGESLSVSVSAEEIKIKGSGANTDYEILAGTIS